MTLLLEVVSTGITGWPLANGGADLEGPKQFYSHVWHLGRDGWRLGSAGTVDRNMFTASSAC